MNLKDGLRLLGIRLYQKWLQVGIMFIIQKLSDGEQSTGIIMDCKDDLPLHP